MYILFTWIAVIVLLCYLWRQFVRGRVLCFYLFCGHAWGTLKEEIRRPLRVIHEALSRKDRKVELDEFEEELS